MNVILHIHCFTKDVKLVARNGTLIELLFLHHSLKFFKIHPKGIAPNT
jgi:hypothetical protein